MQFSKYVLQMKDSCLPYILLQQTQMDEYLPLKAEESNSWSFCYCCRWRWLQAYSGPNNH
jgi:hypothetical protein